ncbi:unnamed protein product [Allacma fusca]|uniref:Uncharacterized protein n=1 Tax=Allacma fusca TaxID=39272 RepID=A0A8J2JGJ1_9HEXA|nr:unnamed protein product [Allacma fusca]
MLNSEASKWAIFAIAMTLQSLLYSYLICHSNEHPVFSPQYLPVNRSAHKFSYKRATNTAEIQLAYSENITAMYPENLVN